MIHLHVHPSLGSDAWSGTRPGPADGGADGPLATLEGARDALRRQRAAQPGPLPATIHLAPGTHRLTQPLRLDARDSETTFRGAADGGTCIDGGQELSGWTLTTHQGLPCWTLDLPEVRRGKWYFRSLFANGVRRPRARLPKFSPTPEGISNVFTIGELLRDSPEDRLWLHEGSNRFKPRPGDFQAWPSLPDAEVVVLHFWTEERLRQPHFDPAAGWVRFSHRSIFALTEEFGPAPARYYIENLFEALSEPGEWYLDRYSGRLHYLPLPGETPENTVVTAPRCSQLVFVRGAEFHDTKENLDPARPLTARRIRFEDLAFQHADWMPCEGQSFRFDGVPRTEFSPASSPQAAYQVPGTLTFQQAQECALVRCTVRRTGFYGIEVGPGCHLTEIARCTLEDLGAGGIRVDGAELDNTGASRTGRTRIADCAISHGGLVFHSGVGILLANTHDNTIEHNHIHHLFYTGISLGWSWGYRHTVARGNLILHNHVHDIGQGLLSDLGAIYCLGVQPGTVIRGNHVHGVRLHQYGGWGIYLDEGSSHIVVENNLIHDTQAHGLSLHFGRDNLIRNNIIAACGTGCVSIGRSEGHTLAHFYHNIFASDAEFLYHGGYAGDTFDGTLRAGLNLFWRPGGGGFEVVNKAPRGGGFTRRATLEEWQALGFDAGSRSADPLFKDYSGRDFTLDPASPAFQLGFIPLDLSTCGPQPLPLP